MEVAGRIFHSGWSLSPALLKPDLNPGAEADAGIQTQNQLE